MLILTDGFLLDTNIISKLSPNKTQLSTPIRLWFHEHGEAGRLFLSAMTIAEIEKGMRSLYRRGGVERAQRLNAWLEALTASFDDRILPMNVVVARIAGALDDAATAQGQSPGLADTIIAATAKAYNLTIVTENLKHFQPFGIDAELPEAFKQLNA